MSNHEDPIASLRPRSFGEQFSGTYALKNFMKRTERVRTLVTNSEYDTFIPSGSEQREVVFDVATDERSKSVWKENAITVEALNRMLRSAGWDEVEYDDVHGQLTLRRIPFGAVSVRLSGGESVRYYEAGTNPVELASKLIRDGCVLPTADGGWRCVPPHQIKEVTWPAEL